MMLAKVTRIARLAIMDYREENTGSAVMPKIAETFRNGRYSAKRKLRDAGGFSLTEMLLCVLIMSLCGGLLTRTMGLGIQHFRSLTTDSDAQVLANTLASSLQMKLACASQVAPGTAESVGGGRLLGEFSTGADDLDVTTKEGSELIRNIWCELATQRVSYVEETDGDGKTTIKRIIEQPEGGGETSEGNGGTEELIIRYHIKGKTDTIDYPLASYYAHGSTGRFHSALSSECKVTYTTKTAGGSETVNAFHVTITVFSGSKSFSGRKALAVREFAVKPVMDVEVKSFH